MISILLLFFGVSQAADSSIGRHVQLQNTQDHPNYFFFLSPPEAVDDDLAGYARFTGDATIKLAGDYRGSIQLYAFPKSKVTQGSLFKHQDVWLELNQQIQAIRLQSKNTVLTPDMKTENATRLRPLEEERETVRFQLEDILKKGIPSSAIACAYDFPSGFLQGGTGVNVTERLSVKTLTDEKCKIEERARKPPLPKSNIAKLDSDSAAPEEMGCGCASSSTSSSGVLATLLVLIAFRRQRVLL